MPLYPLGISRSHDVSQIVGEVVGGPAGVRWSRAGELACAFIDAPHDAFKPLQHAAMLGAIHRRLCVLPMRFGATLRDEAEIHALLQTRRSELLERLGQLDGACEMGLRIVRKSPGTMATDPAAETASPLGYLERRRSCYQRADATAELDRQVVRRFEERLQGLYRDWRRLPATPARLIRLAFLVERDRVAAFRHGVADASRDGGPGQCAVLGPWPPYSFV
jgi:hypothetical protein